MSASTTKIFLSPNRVNLKFSVTKVKKQDMMKQLEWVVQEGKEKGVEMAKMIILCNSLVDIAGVVNWLMMRLGSAAFHPQDSRKRKDCIIGIYHSLSLEQNKERVTAPLPSVTFLSTTARPAPPRRVLSKMAATKKRTPGFLAEEKLQRLPCFDVVLKMQFDSFPSCTSEFNYCRNTFSFIVYII